MMSMFNVVANQSDLGELYESCSAVWNSLAAEASWAPPEKDDTEWLLMGKEGKGCEWVSEDPKQRCLVNPCPETDDDEDSCSADGAFIVDCNTDCDKFCIDPTADPAPLPEGAGAGPLSKICSFYCASRAKSCVPTDRCMSELSIPFRSAAVMCPTTCGIEDKDKDSGTTSSLRGCWVAVVSTVLVTFFL